MPTVTRCPAVSGSVCGGHLAEEQEWLIGDLAHCELGRGEREFVERVGDVDSAGADYLGVRPRHRGGHCPVDLERGRTALKPSDPTHVACWEFAQAHQARHQCGHVAIREHDSAGDVGAVGGRDAEGSTVGDLDVGHGLAALDLDADGASSSNKRCGDCARAANGDRESVLLRSAAGPTSTPVVRVRGFR